jgi:hypothetical protein
MMLVLKIIPLLPTILLEPKDNADGVTLLELLPPLMFISKISTHQPLLLEPSLVLLFLPLLLLVPVFSLTTLLQLPLNKNLLLLDPEVVVLLVKLPRKTPKVNPSLSP